MPTKTDSKTLTITAQIGKPSAKKERFELQTPLVVGSVYIDRAEWVANGSPTEIEVTVKL